MKALLGLGSNLGDKLANLQAAVNFLDLRAGKVLRISRVYETSPVYVMNQPHFFNACVLIETALEPLALLDCVKAIEMEVGRMQRERNGPREIDVDLIAMVDDAGELIRVNEQRLTLPHPRIAERRFVLEPLQEIAPDLTPKGGLDKQKLNLQSVEPVQNAVLSVHRD